MEPGFARAYAGLSFTHFQSAFLRYADDVSDAAKLAQRYAEQCLEHDPVDPFGNFTMGRAFWLRGDLGTRPRHFPTCRRSQEGESGHSRPATSAWAECHIETLSPSLSNGRKGQPFTFIKIVLAPSMALPHDAAKSQASEVASTHA